MIIVRIMGGLGNQMAQYAFGSVVAAHLNTKLYVDTSWYDHQAKDVHRDFILPYFNRALAIIHSSQIHRLQRYYRFPFYLLPRAMQEFIRYFSRFRVVRETPQLLQLNTLSRLKDYYFDGYWLKTAYFTGKEDFVRSLFTFRKPSTSVASWITKIKRSSFPISIHIRRGDYVTNPKARAFHGVLPITYYRKGISYFNSRVKKPTYFVFSDDLSWAREHLPQGNMYYFVSHGAADYEDMRLMSLCKHHIVANSTFSWWGAWLNPSTRKIVVAPKRWFLTLPTDIYPSDWTQL